MGRTTDVMEPRPLTRRQVVISMGGVMVGMLLAAMDQAVVATAMPSVIADLGGFDRYTWVTTAYVAASVTAIPIVGRLSDLYGRKGFYVAGVAIFLIGSVLAAMSQTIDQLIAFRAVQGLGGGVMLTLAFVIVGDLFPPAERGKYMGLVSAVFGVSSVIGPTLGGIITDSLSWNWIFYFNLPLGIPVLLLLARFLPQSLTTTTASPGIDLPGMALLILTVVPLLIGLSLGGVQYEWQSPVVIGTLVFAAVMGATFVSVELRAADPIMPLGIYRDRTVSLCLIAVFCTGFGLYGSIILLPLFFQAVMGASATGSGGFLTPMLLGMVVGATVSGQALSRLGGHYRIQGLAGVTIMATGMFLVSRMTPDMSFGEAVFYIAITGFGLGTTFPTFDIAVQNAVPQSILGMVTSVTHFSRNLGGAIGLAVMGSFMASRFATGLSNSLPEELKQALSPGGLAEVSKNPQALLDPGALSSLQTTIRQQAPGGADLADQLLQILREALASAIGEVYLVGMAALGVALVSTVFLKELPLRRTNTMVGEGAGR